MKNGQRPTVEDQFARFVASGGTWPTATGWHFLSEVRRAADASIGERVGFGWMQQVIEWEWNHRTGDAWGPAHFGERTDKERAAWTTLANAATPEERAQAIDALEGMCVDVRNIRPTL